jgi:two-component system cell cycle sensor histidine kinase/response regulator CckA
MNVLLVDDHDHFRQTASKLLAFLGHNALEARDEHEAEEAFATHASEIDMLMVDMFLGASHGPTLAARLEAARPGLRVLFMSGYGAGVLSEAELTGPRRHFIGKPFSVGMLRDAVAELLARP